MSATNTKAPHETAVVTGVPLLQLVSSPDRKMPAAAPSPLSAFRFYEGMSGEWRWYRLDSRGDVSKAGDHSFGSLLSCMLNAEAHGFLARKNYVVYARALQRAPQ